MAEEQKIRDAAASGPFGRERAPRLQTMARFINERAPHLMAEITEGYCNTDRKIPNSRLRIPGLGRYGNKIVVRNRTTNEVVLEHNSAQTYRHNSEVAEWIVRNILSSPTSSRGEGDG